MNMKVMLVINKDETGEILEQNLHPLGFEFIIYRNPLKAMDNLEEVKPDIVLFSAEDFPRHWKPFLSLLRKDRKKDECVMVLLVGDFFPFEEAAKAVYLQVNGVISEDLQDKRKMMRMENLLSRYKMIAENRTGLRYIPDDYDEIEFIFSHPETMKLITGLIDDISNNGMGFSPDSPHLTSDLEEDAEISSCSLRINDDIFSVNCRVVRNGKNLALAFIKMPEEDNFKLQEYIDNRPARELKHLEDAVQHQS